VFKNWAYYVGFWAYKAGLLLTGINEVIPDQTILALSSRRAY